MKIGIIGAGQIGQTLGRAFVSTGHSVQLSSRHPETLGDLANNLGVQVGTVEETAEFGEVILLAVNYNTVDDAINRIQPYVHGKLVVDTTNPLQFAKTGGTERVLADDLIAGEVMQTKLPTARIGKAFTTLWHGHLEKQANASPRVAMTLAADQEADREVLAALIENTGFEPVNLGTLAQSRPLDPPSPIWNIVLSANELTERVAQYRASL